MKKTAEYYLECLLYGPLDWEDVPEGMKDEVWDLSLKRERQKDGINGGWNQPL